MPRINCYLPIKVCVTGRLSDTQLEQLSATLVRVVSARIAFAEGTIFSGDQRNHRGGHEIVREEYQAARHEMVISSYGLPSYNQAGSPRSVPITSATLFPATALRTFAQIWQDFDQARSNSRKDVALALAPELLIQMSGQDALRRGRDIAMWLMDQNEWALAEDALRRLEAAWWLRHAGEKSTGVPLSGPGDDPQALLSRAMAEARAGHHQQAFLLFGLAFVFIQMQLSEVSARREKSLKSTEDNVMQMGAQRFHMGEVLTGFGRGSSYPDIAKLIELMRTILGFYASLEREAQRAGNQILAAQFSSLGFLLRNELREHHTFAGVEIIIMETTQTPAPRGGIGYTIYGRQGAKEIVTPLPGTRTPEEIGFFPPYVGKIEELLDTIYNQEDFLTTLDSRPEIRAAFRTRRINMNDLNDRLDVWRIMYKIFQGEHLDPLSSLLRLIEQYLKYFTRHTDYNIRDFGVNYLTTEWPEDLVGLTVRDCGVYALSVAHEVYLTARGATPRLPVDFELFAMPEHITLAIIDRSQDVHYVVNNDRIDGPKREPVGASLARAYADTFERPFAVTPMMRVDIREPRSRASSATTGMGPSTFRDTAWRRYQVATQWGFAPEDPTGPGDTRSEDERLQAIHRQFHEAKDLFNNGSQTLQDRLDLLSQGLSKAPASTRQTLLQEQLPELTAIGVALAGLFITFGSDPKINALNAHVASQLQKDTLFVFDGTHLPVVRLGMALLHFENLGNNLTNDQQELLRLLRMFSVFKKDLDSYSNAGLPPVF